MSSSTVVGETLITVEGINALIEAQATGESIRPKYFTFSEQDLALTPALSASDLHPWLTQNIDLYTLTDDHHVEFVCDVPPNEATHYTRIAGLYLEDGTLFAVAKPPFAFPPMLRQTFKVQVAYANAGELMNFQYISHAETEQSLSVLESTAQLGEAIMRNAQYIAGIDIFIQQNKE